MQKNIAQIRIHKRRPIRSSHLECRQFAKITAYSIFAISIKLEQMFRFQLLLIE